MVNNLIVEQAMAFAVQVHGGMRRKAEDIPYILHPMEAASIVATLTEDKEIIAAAVLHDVAEDTGTTLADVERMFGKRVATLVASETEDKRPDRPAAETWEMRKLETLSILTESDDIAIKMLWMGDKLSNMRSLYRQYLKSGQGLWKAFHQQDPEKQKWYYTTVAQALSDLKDTLAWQEYNDLVNKIFS